MCLRPARRRTHSQGSAAAGRGEVSVLLGATHGMAPDTLWVSGMHARGVCEAVGVTQTSVQESGRSRFCVKAALSVPGAREASRGCERIMLARVRPLQSVVLCVWKSVLCSN